MIKYLALLVLLSNRVLNLRENCMIEVIQRQIRYKGLKYAQVTEEQISSAFQIFSENGNKVQQELIQKLIFNFDLLDTVGAIIN